MKTHKKLKAKERQRAPGYAGIKSQWIKDENTSPRALRPTPQGQWPVSARQ